MYLRINNIMRLTIRSGLVRLQVSVHDKSPGDTWRKVGGPYLREALGNAVAWGRQDMAKGTQRDWGIKETRWWGGGHGEISFQLAAGTKGAKLLRTVDLPTGFANAPQVQGLHSLSSLSKCIDFTGPLESAHQICWAPLSFFGLCRRNCPRWMLLLYIVL